MKLNRLRRYVLISILSFLFIGCQTGVKKMTYANFDIQGHRGARAVRPENTLAAFDYALSVGVTTLELDTVVTKDNVVVVSHDLTINPIICRTDKGRIPKKDTYIREMSFAELQTYDCGSIKNPRFPKQVPVPGAKIPSLDELFAFVKKSSHPGAKSVLFNIETKSNPSLPKAQPTPKDFVSLIVESAKKHKMMDRISLQSFDHRTLLAMAQLAPDIRRVALFESPPKDILKAVKAARSSVFSPDYHWLTEEDVQEMQENGIKVIPWTANDEEAWERLLTLQVDGIITDDPAALIAYITRRDGRIED